MSQRTSFCHIELNTRAAGTDGGIPCVLASDVPIDRGGYREILDHSPASIDLSRASLGLALLLRHDQTRPIGRVESIRTDGHNLRGTARFSSNPEGQQAKADVEAGILPALSVGYRDQRPRRHAQGDALDSL